MFHMAAARRRATPTAAAAAELKAVEMAEEAAAAAAAAAAATAVAAVAAAAANRRAEVARELAPSLSGVCERVRPIYRNRSIYGTQVQRQVDELSLTALDTAG